MTDELCYLPATEALQRFRARELSPVELMHAVIDRAGQTEPTVNALCHTFYDEALALDLVHHAAFSRAAVASVRKLGFAGAPMTDALLQKLVAAFAPPVGRTNVPAGIVIAETIVIIGK